MLATIVIVFAIAVVSIINLVWNIFNLISNVLCNFSIMWFSLTSEKNNPFCPPEKSVYLKCNM